MAAGRPGHERAPVYPSPGRVEGPQRVKDHAGASLSTRFKFGIRRDSFLSVTFSPHGEERGAEEKKNKYRHAWLDFLTGGLFTQSLELCLGKQATLVTTHFTGSADGTAFHEVIFVC